MQTHRPVSYTHLIYLHADNPAEAAVIRHFDAACEDCRRHYEGYELMMISRLTAAWAALYSLLSPNLLSYSTAMEEDLSTQRNMISFIYRNYTQKLSPVSYTHLDVYKRQTVVSGS